jgi:hypothetical protein
VFLPSPFSIFLACSTSAADENSREQKRLEACGQVFKEIMDIPDGIPKDLGGKRAGAGRKRKEVNPEYIRARLREFRDNVARIVRGDDDLFKAEVKTWGKLLGHKDVHVRLEARILLSRLAYPCPKYVDTKPVDTEMAMFKGWRPKWAKDADLPPSGAE